MSAASLAALNAGSAVAQSVETKPNKRKIKKAINLGMIAGNMPIQDKFALAKDLGFDGLEINTPGGPDKKEVIKAAEKTGLQVAGVMNSVHWKYPLSHPDPEARKQGLDGLKIALKDAKDFNCSTVLLVPGVVNKDIPYDAAYKRTQNEIRKILPLAEDLNVAIAVENVWNHFLLSPLEAAQYVDEFNSKSIGWFFDAGNIVNFGWPEQWIRILDHRILNIHVKEFSRAKRNNEGLWKGFDVKLMEGDNDWPAIMKAIDGIDYHGWFIAEIPGGGEKRLKEIAERMDTIMSL